MNLTMASESSILLRPQLSSSCRISATISAISDPLLALGIHISVNLDRSAGLNSLLPKSPPGFMVAKNLKLGCATIFSEKSPPFSASVISLPDSKTLFSLSMTASSAKLISSSTNMSPSFMAVTKGPSCHSNNDFDLCQRVSAACTEAVSEVSIASLLAISFAAAETITCIPPLSLFDFLRGTGEGSFSFSSDTDGHRRSFASLRNILN